MRQDRDPETASRAVRKFYSFSVCFRADFKFQ